MDFLKIGNRLELFCDDYLLDTLRTDASHLLHTPVRRDTVMVNNELWEGNVSNYFNFFYDEDIHKYRMYYKAGQAWADSPTIAIHRSSRFCYAESEDGITWTKPNLGLTGNTNILTGDLNIDNFYVFRDTNPRCPAGERYKAFCGCGSLWYYVSPDGIHFDLDRGTTVMKRGAGYFDSLNTVRWSEETGKYICFFRASRLPDGSFPIGDDWENLKECVRGIMYSSSEDLIHWDEPVPFEYSDNRVFEMYTNCAFGYYRAPHIYIALPTRYVQRRTWNTNYDELGGREARLERFRNSEAGRSGLAVTEALFMTSRDGIHWTRSPEAFLRPGPQTEENWLYGGGYPAVGVIETRSGVCGAGNELSVYVPEGRSSWKPNELIRYTLRLDGFMSMHAGIEPKRVMTKPLIYSGENMVINFSTSAYGFIQIKIKDDHNNERISPELFGDSTERKVAFFNGKAGELSGRPVTVEFCMSDADLYSVRFL